MIIDVYNYAEYVIISDFSGFLHSKWVYTFEQLYHSVGKWSPPSNVIKI